MQEEIRTPLGWQIFGAALGVAIAVALIWFVFPDISDVARLFLIGGPIGVCGAATNVLYARRRST